MFLVINQIIINDLTKELPLQEQVGTALGIALKAHRGQRDLDASVPVRSPHITQAIAAAAAPTAATTLTCEDITRAGAKPAIVELSCFKSVISLLDLAEFFDVLLKLLTTCDGTVLDPSTIVIDRVDAIVQELSNLR